jgi:hypothetical protein
MRRRDFLKTGGTVAIAAGVPYVPPHNFDKYDFGSGPQVSDRLNVSDVTGGVLP